MSYYKFLCEGGISPYASAQWSLPTKNDDGTWTPGDWMPALEGEPVECKHGYHLLRPHDLSEWLNAELYEVEADGPVTEYNTKCATTARCRLVRRIEAWNERTARHFACDCAKRVLHIYESKYPDDDRPRQAIATARRYADGDATKRELGAAWDAAWDAAWATARGAARGAAWDAAWAAARAAARGAEKEWQIQHLWCKLGSPFGDKGGQADATDQVY